MPTALPTEPGAQPHGGSCAVELRDGRVVTIRPMHHDDGDRLVRFHEGLSAETQRRRFFSVHPHLSPTEVSRFTNLDHHHREALVAIAGDDIVGVGRLEILAGGRDAEVAFVVADGCQGQGLGTILMQRVAVRAAELGADRLIADTLLHNDRMLAVLRHSGLPHTSRFDDGVVRVTLELTG